MNASIQIGRRTCIVCVCVHARTDERINLWGYEAGN